MKSLTDQQKEIGFLTALYDAGIRLNLHKDFCLPEPGHATRVQNGDPLFVGAYKTNSPEAVYVIPYNAAGASYRCSIMPARVSRDLEFNFDVSRQNFNGELSRLEPKQDHPLGLRGYAAVRRNGKEQNEFYLYGRWNPEIFNGVDTQPINLLEFMVKSYLPNLDKRSSAQSKEL